MVSAVASEHKQLSPGVDDALTMCAISIVGAILTNVLHEGVGHGLTALLTGAKSGLLTTGAWSSAFDSRLVEAGGTLANLAAALVFWLALRSATLASIPMRYFLLITCAYNLFTGTGYFFFSGVSNFGDWAAVISGLHPHWLWRALLVIVGASSYFAAALVLGIGLVRHVGVPQDQQRRLRKLTILPYLLRCCPGKRGGTAESAWDATAVAIRAARQCKRIEPCMLLSALRKLNNRLRPLYSD